MKANSPTLTRWVRRLAIPVLLIGLIAFLRSFWFFVVPPGMDTMPELIPPGSTCVVERNPTALVADKSIIFLEVEPGAAPILVRVGRIEDGRVFPVIDNPKSRFAGYANNSYPLQQVRFLVLGRFTPDEPATQPGPARKR